MIKFTKNSDSYEFKTSFEGEWIQASLKLARGRKRVTQPIEINLKAAYQSKINISDAKKRDLIQLLRSDIVPSFYEGFYNSL
ncbi:unnamed protein product [Euphydryas editha]|uniref:Uncharacterized protein n=1 Tax=Euphydryas editha TaxID=104508 RepID=A0AAU9VG88_EUPED|nr:unnamed protein product [Euphydryas editha]